MPKIIRIQICTNATQLIWTNLAPDLAILKKEFVINIFLLILVNALIKPIYLFGIDRNIQLIVGTEAYGNYVNILNFTFILQFISDFGLQNYMSRFVSQDSTNAKNTYSKILSFKLILSIVYFCSPCFLPGFGMEKNSIFAL